MSLFYTASTKEVLQVRNKLFLEKGIPALLQHKFAKSPYLGANFGWHAGIGYLYEFCRLIDDKYLEMINVSIMRGDRWIQIRLNIFELNPAPMSVDQLNGLEGIQFHLPPNKRTEMQLYVDDIKGIPLFSYDFISEKHKLKNYFTKRGFMKRVKTLGNQIEKDLLDIDRFIVKWHEFHQPIATNWEGK